MKKIFAAALALVLALSVIGCSVAPSAGEGDTAVVDSDEAVATIGDRKVTFGEYKQLFDAQYYAMMGYDISADEEGTKQLQDSIIDALVVNEIIAYQAAQSGYDKLGDEKLLTRVKKMLEIRKPYTTIIQADGFPMSGGKDDFKTTLQAVAAAEIFQNANLPAYLVISGGTNAKSTLLAKQCDINLNGIAIGSYARKIVKEFIEQEDFFENEKNFNDALAIAKNLVETSLKYLAQE